MRAWEKHGPTGDAFQLRGASVQKLARKSGLAVAVAARVTAPRAVRMTVGAGFAAIVLVVLSNGFAGVHDAEAGITSTFHLRNGSHHLLQDTLEFVQHLNRCSCLVS